MPRLSVVGARFVRADRFESDEPRGEGTFSIVITTLPRTQKCQGSVHPTSRPVFLRYRENRLAGVAMSPRILPYVCTDTEPCGWVINTPLYISVPSSRSRPRARYRLIIIEFRLFREDSGHPLTGAARRELRTCLPNSGPAFFGSPCVLPALPTRVGTLAIAKRVRSGLSLSSRDHTGSFRLLRCLRQLFHLDSRRV